MKLTIQPITKPISQDLIKEIFQINNSVQSNPWTKSAIQTEIENPLSLGWLATMPTSKPASKTPHSRVDITGYIFIRKNEGEVEIMSIGVIPEYQRKGVGQKLLSCVLSQFSRGTVIYLEVSHLNEGALTLYKKMGFTISATRKAYYPDGSDAICMKLNIANP